MFVYRVTHPFAKFVLITCEREMIELTLRYGTRAQFEELDPLLIDSYKNELPIIIE